jgi:hypothetical protein
MQTFRVVLSVSLLTALTACASDDLASSAAAPSRRPLTGVPATGDAADHACNVVLRTADRIDNGMGGYVDNAGSYVWEGAIDISAAADAEGLVPSMLYHHGSDPTWYEVTATRDDAHAAPTGFARFHFRIDSHLPGPSLSGTSLTSSRVDLIPLLHVGDARLFDHNRMRGDFDTYLIAWSSFFRITDDAAACPAGSAPGTPPATPPPGAPAPQADVWFAANGAPTQTTNIIQGGQLTVHYAIERLAACRATHNGYPAWDELAHARFLPGGETAQASVRVFDTQYGTPIGPGHSLPTTFAVPAGATSVELWFENFGIGCQAWDSQSGANYRFEVEAPPSWLGNAVQRISRDSSARCDGGAWLSPGSSALYDPWARTRATVRNVCFEAWQPGLTDVWPADLWKKLDAQVHWRFAPDAQWSTAYASLDGKAGNNARWYFDLSPLDPFAPYTCPSVPVTVPESSDQVIAHAEAYFTVNGVELRPSGPGSTFDLEFTDDANDPWRAANCAH